MPYISLTAKDTDNHYGSYQTDVLEQSYPHCQLFIKYKHQPKQGARSGNIDIYIKYSRVYLDGGSHVTLELDGYYSRMTLEYEDVYFNRYERKTPLILVLIFKETSVDAPNRYYKLTNIGSEIEQRKTIAIRTLPEYNTDRDILTYLLGENDILKHVLTFEMSKKDEKGNAGTKYNSERILVKKLSKPPDNEEHLTSLLKKLGSDGFTSYRHEPVRDYMTLQCYYLYSDDLPKLGHKQPIQEIQGGKYNVTVYYSNNVDIPLLLEFNKGGHSYSYYIDNFYYYHSRENDGSLYWKKIVPGPVLELEFKEGKIYTQLSGNDFTMFLKLLKALKSHLLKTLVLIIDKKEGYSKINVTKSFSDHTKHRLINSNYDIPVTDKTQSNGKCLSGSNIIVYEHEFSNCVKGILDPEQVLIKFIIPTTNSTSYNELKLYKNGSLGKEKETLYYTGNDNNLYVFFYGSNDSRPLLLCYNGKTYAPKDKSNYSNEWYRIENISNCTCKGVSGPPKLGATDQPLLNGLSGVVKFLNEICLDERPDKMTVSEPDSEGKSNEFKLYGVHTYKGSPINIKVTYSNMKCHRLYKHTPYGIKGQSDGYRLGNIKFRTCNLSYSSQLPLSSVTSYHSVYDKNHDYPLLVLLTFKSESVSNSEYHKLKSKDQNKTWEKIDLNNDLMNKISNPNTIENGLYEIRQNLKITFSKDQNESYLFKTTSCKEDEIDWLSIGAGSAAGLVGLIGIIVGGILVFKKVTAASAASAVAAAATAAAL